jgi:hypothetical protein
MATAGIVAGMAALAACGQVPQPASPVVSNMPARAAEMEASLKNPCAPCLTGMTPDVKAGQAVPLDDETAAEEAQILQLAKVLKGEVEENSQDNLLVDVVRKASLIGRLAKDLKNEIKLTSQLKRGHN